MTPEELKAHAQNVLERYPDAKHVIAFSDGNVFLDRDKNAAELHAATSKRTPQRFDREAQAETAAAPVAADDLKAGSTATDALAGKSDALPQKPAEEPAATEKPAEEPAIATEEPVTTPAQGGDATTETPDNPAVKGKGKN